MEGGKMVVFGSWMLYFGQVGSLWELCAKVGSSWGEKVITPTFLYFPYLELLIYENLP
jgi:hypothetical protein